MRSIAGSSTDEGSPCPLAFLDEVALAALIAAVVNGELQHAPYEDHARCPTAGPIHGPGVNVMGVGAHDHMLWSALSMVRVKSMCQYSEFRLSL